MLSANQKISLRQLQILIIVNALGTGLIVLPRRGAAYAGTDAWLVVAGLTLLAIFFGTLAVTASEKTRDSSFVAYTSWLFSKPVALLLGMGLWLRLIISAGLEIRVFTMVVRTFLLTTTPAFVVSFTMLAIGAYAAVKGIETRARIAEVLLLVLLAVFLFLLTVSFFDLDLSNLKPVMTTPPRHIFEGVLSLGYIFTGLECLLLVSPHLNKKHPQKSAAAAIACAGLIMVIITVQAIAKFGAYEIAHQPWPVLRILEMINFPGAFIARKDALVISFWIISVFLLCNALLFFSASLARDMIGKQGKHKYYVILCAFLAWGISCLPISETQIYLLLDRLYGTVGIFYLLILPLLLLCGSAIKKVKTPALLATLLLLTGCWDQVKLEDRALVMAIGIDKAEEDNARYTVSVSIPGLKQGEKESEKSTIQKASGKTVTEAFRNLDAKTPKKIYLGQAKLLMISDEVAEEAELFKSAMDALDKNNELDWQILVLIGDPTQFEDESKDENETMPGLAIADIYKDKSKISGLSFKQDFTRLCAQMRTNGNGLIPIAEKGQLSGAAVMKDYRRAGELNKESLRGYLWGESRQCEGTVVMVKADGIPVPITVVRHRAKLHFAEIDERLHCLIEVEIKGKLNEFIFGETLRTESTLENLTRCFEQTIADEITLTAKKMQREYAVDGYHLMDELRKNRLHEKYTHDWERAFVEMEIVPSVRVELE